jgi:integrase
LAIRQRVQEGKRTVLAGQSIEVVGEARRCSGEDHQADRLAHTQAYLLDSLRANGTDIKVQQELLRHSNVQTTLQVYTQAVTEQKRAANAMVVDQLLADDSVVVASA